ncbi:MAG: helix-turn-helix domain-containing protein [Planctomycetes bacterium]|jgi:hypothetical protein|nr:helix-turn-helix domain-containing protein [Planctomycetota bacterium]
MGWSFENVFYGSKERLNLRSMRDFLMQGFYPIPQTLFKGYWRAVCRGGDHDRVYAQIAQPFPEALLAQRPEGRFAVQLSGGFDSSIVAKVYDREDVDYIHFTGPETYKARALAATFKGRLHEIQVTPELFLREADEMLSRGKAAARKLMHARILLKADGAAGNPGWNDERIAEALEVGRATVERIRREFMEGGFEAALERRKPRRVYQRKLDGDGEAHLVALTCQEPPEGHSRWTLQLPADRMVELEYVDPISCQTVRRTLKKARSSLG